MEINISFVNFLLGQAVYLAFLATILMTLLIIRVWKWRP